jgi:hypothetical protein
MDLKLNLQELKTPQDILRLTSVISILADELDTIISTTAPNGSISAREGRKCLYKNGSTYEVWENVDGGTVWQRTDAGISIPLTYLDIDDTLAANSDAKVASQKATKGYVDTRVPIPLTTAKGGTGSTANANAANGVAVNDNSGYLVGDGRNLTNLPNTGYSNVLWQWHGSNATSGAGHGHNGLYIGTVTAPQMAYQIYMANQETGYPDDGNRCFETKFRKVAGISTITVYVYLAGQPYDTYHCACTVTVGGISYEFLNDTTTTPTWYSHDFDVSGLTNGTVYDVDYQLKGAVVAAPGKTRLYDTIAFGS